MEQSPLWHRAVAFILLPIIITVAAIAGLFEKPVQRTPEDVAKYLADFIDDASGPTDWDDFTSVKIADPVLDDIRARAANVRLPLPNTDTTLRELLAEAQGLHRRSI
ncbi:hypothetical protein BH10PSE2_BH10PSE2_26100 [soil metagenome]